MDAQLSFASLDFAGKKKRTKRDVFLAEMAAVVPWSKLEALIEPHYPKVGPHGGRRPFPIAVMLRIYCQKPVVLARQLREPANKLLGVVPAHVDHGHLPTSPTVCDSRASSCGDASVPFFECHLELGNGKWLCDRHLVLRAFTGSRSDSSSGEPIMNLPAGMTIITGQPFAHSLKSEPGIPTLTFSYPAVSTVESIARRYHAVASCAMARGSMKPRSARQSNTTRQASKTLSHCAGAKHVRS